MSGITDRIDLILNRTGMGSEARHLELMGMLIEQLNRCADALEAAPRSAHGLEATPVDVYLNRQRGLQSEDCYPDGVTAARAARDIFLGDAACREANLAVLDSNGNPTLVKYYRHSTLRSDQR